MSSMVHVPKAHEALDEAGVPSADEVTHTHTQTHMTLAPSDCDQGSDEVS